MERLRAKKILFVDHTPFVGGAQLSLIAHVESLDKAEFIGEIACSTQAEQLGLAQKYSQAGIVFASVDFPRLRPFGVKAVGRWFRSVSELRRLVRSRKPDLVVANTVRASLVASLAAFLEGVPSCWFIRDMTFPLGLFMAFGILPRRIIFNSKATKRHYASAFWGGVKGELVYIGRNFHKKLQHADHGAIARQRNEWRDGQDVLLVGFVGRLVRWKGAQTLVEAMRILKRRGVPAKAIILGTGSGQEGDNEDELKRAAEAWGLSGHVIFAGHKNDLVVPMAALDALALTSIEPEPFSSAVVDAMQAGLVVVGTAIGGTPEIVKDGETGLLVSPDRPEELAAAVERLVKDKGLFDRLSANGRESAVGEYAAEHTTAQIMKIYSSIVN